jgi:hypothetical protein
MNRMTFCDVAQTRASGFAPPGLGLLVAVVRRDRVDGRGVKASGGEVECHGNVESFG